MTRSATLLLAAALAAAPADPPGGRGTPARPSTAAPPTPAAPVRLGVDVLLGSDHVELLRGKRVGLVTNPSGVDGRLVPTADRLAADERFELVQLYGPEHGIRGDAPAGEAVADARDPVTGLPVESLFGASKRPSPASLERLDALVFDVQDVGSRAYTYVSTLGEVVTACAEAGVPVVVLDRPNPLGGMLFEGPIREERWKSFVGWGPIPVTHGMTIGELARFYEGELGLGCEVHVVPMRGWRRSMQWEDTGLHWTPTSPHVPHALTAHVYVATGMVGGVAEHVNEGVGYTLPFETLAATYLDGPAFCRAMEAHELPGVRFVPIAYVPFYGGQEGAPLRGARLVLEDRRAFRPLRTALAAMTTIERLHPGRAGWRDGRPFAIHWGTERVLERVRAGWSVARIEAEWREELERFAAARARYLLYPP